tara:strand:+ start:10316 stop:11371 length:1056 start_codon:yes stop_codon:yes gene_type:complete
MSINTDNLSMKQKIELFKKLYAEIAKKGKNGDTHLAHINAYERELLIQHGGCGTVNDETELMQYFGGGGGGSTPAETQTTFTREAPEIEARKLALYDTAAEVTSQPINIPAFQVAGPSALEQQAYQDAGMTGTGTAAVNQGIASALSAQQRAQAMPNIDAFLNPYNQFIIDEINRQAGMQSNQISADALRSGAFGGGREGVQQAELMGATQRAVGQAQAQNFGRALQAAQQQQGLGVQTDLGVAQALGGFGAQQQAMQAQDLQTQMAVGQSQRNLAQQALAAQRQTDIARAYEPYQRLEFQKGIMTALPTAASQVTQSTAPGTNPLAQAAGLGLTAAKTYNILGGTGVGGK